MTIKGYFNESCKICRTDINHYKKMNQSIKWVDVINNKKAINETQLSSKQLIRRLHIIENNRIYSGINAFLIIWREIPRYRLIAKLISLPIIYHICWLVYELLAIILFYKNKNLLKEIKK